MAKPWTAEQRSSRHVLVEAIEDIGKEADRSTDDEDPIAAEDEFTVSYGVSETDREKYARRHSVCVETKARTSSACVDTFNPIVTGSKTNEMSEKEFRRIFSEASALAEERRKLAERDKLLLRWLVTQVNERGLKSMAQLLNQ